MTRWFKAALFCAVAMGSANVSAQLVNGSFELGGFVADINGTMSLGPGATTITGWTVISGENTPFEISWHDNANVFGPTLSSHGTKHLDLTGYDDTTPYGGVQQVVTTTTGQLYSLGFDVAANQHYSPTSAVMVSAGATSGLFMALALPPEGTVGPDQTIWTHFMLPFIATGPSTTISLVGTTSTNFFIGLDNVTLTAVAAIPEPSTYALMIAGLGLVGFVAARRRRTAETTAV